MHIMIDALSSYSGGARTSMRYLLPRMARRPGIRISVVCREDQKQGFGINSESPVQWVPVPAQIKPLSARLAFSGTVVPVLAKSHKADVLFCPTDHAPPVAPCAVTMMIRNPTPYVKGMSTVVSPARRAREAAMRAVTLASSWRSQRIILVSHAALDATAAVIPLPLERVRVVHHGRDDRFSPTGEAREENSILSVSSIYAFKNYPVLIDAMKVLGEKYGKKPKLKIAGAYFDEEHAAHLQQKTKELGLDGQIEFLGEVPHAKLVDLYRKCSFFVMPSRLETFGHPYIESMATGTAAIIGDIPCAREMCGDAVLYHDVNSPEDLAATMNTLLSDEKLRKELEAKGPKRAEQFSWERCCDETLQVFEESLVEWKRGRSGNDIQAGVAG